MTEAAAHPISSESGKQPGLRRLAMTLPLVLVLVGYFWFSTRTTHRRLIRPWTTSGIEAQLVMDAWRILEGRPVYTDPAINHATHMYGPLMTYLTVPLVRQFGVDVRPPRYISLSAAIGFGLLGGVIWLRQRGWLAAVAGFCLCYFQFYRLRDWATESRPDAPFLLLAFIAIILFYRACAAAELSQSVKWTLAGTVTMLLGFLFKQPAAAVALVPPVVLLMQRPRDLGARLGMASVPFVALAGLILLLKFAWPWVYFHMITVPATYPVDWGVFTLGLLELIRFNTLFFAVLIGWLVLRSHQHPRNNIELWLLATIAVLSIPLTLARAKWGGSYNSLLPIHLAMALFSAWMLPEILGYASSSLRAAAAWFIAVVVAVLPLVDMTITMRGTNTTPPGQARLSVSISIARAMNPGASALEHGGPNVLKVIDVARNLPGTFVSPDDPTIALRAKQYVGRTAASELDANGRELPAYLVDEIRQADWALQVARGWPSGIPDAVLASLGFQKTRGVIPIDNVYTLWRRSTPATLPN